MNFYKVVQNDKITDVLENPVWVKQSKNGLIILCDVSEATGVVSSDSETILHIEGKAPFINRECQDITLADITEDEAEELKVLLNLGADITDSNEGESIEWNEDEVPEEPIEEDATLAEVKERNLAKLSNDCQNTIYSGIDVTLTDGTVRHFDLEIEDQLNLLTLSTLVATGETSIPYHASDELCTYYSVEDISKIIDSATNFKTYHTSYYNSLKNWIMSMDNIAEIGNVVYGAEIPAEYCSEVLLELTQKLNDKGDADETAE